MMGATKKNAMAHSPTDPRLFQIGFLSVFLIWVVATSSFAMAPAAMVAVFGSALATQAVCVRLLGLPPPGPFSPLISSLSLCLLLRTGSVWVAALAAALAIASKFALRVGGKHVFNPTNLGLLAVVLVTGDAWISPGQWGTGAVLAFFLAALGLTVVRKVGRGDITFAFLAAHLTLQIGRVLYLGERPEVVLHRLSAGSLIVFAFFMISDPRSTPDRRLARVTFAAIVAAVAYVLTYQYFVPSAPLWALLIVSPLTPVLDRLWRGPRFDWATKGAIDAVQTPHATAQRVA